MRQLWDKVINDILPRLWAFLILFIITLGLVGGAISLVKWFLNVLGVIV